MASPWTFVTDGFAAGMAHPGYGDALAVRLRELSRAGFAAMVSLSTSAPDSNIVEKAGLSHLHVPIPDFGAPTPAQFDRIVEFVESVTAGGGPAVVHCTSGYGRTGTVLAALLVALKGMKPGDAVRLVRKKRPGSIETDEQLAAVREYAERLERSSGSR